MPEKLAQLLLACFGREPTQMLQRRLIGAQLIELMLREVAYRESCAATQLSALRRQITGNRFHQCRLASAVDAEDSNAVARAHVETHATQHRSLAVTERDVVSIEQPLGKFQWLRKFESPFAPRAHRFDRGQTVEHLQPALCLPRLRRLRAKAVDEALQVRRSALVLP